MSTETFGPLASKAEIDTEVEYEAARQVTTATLQSHLDACLQRDPPSNVNLADWAVVMATSAAIAAASAVAHARKLQGLAHWSVYASFVRAWDGSEGPIKLTRWENMLNPVHANQFARVVPDNAVDFLKAKALARLEFATSDTEKKLLRQIAAGQFPYGYTEESLLEPLSEI